MAEHAQPLILVSFPDPADVRRVWEALRFAFKCEWEDGGILMYDRLEDGTVTLRHDPRADEAYRGVSAAVGDEIARAESKGVVPTIEGRHKSRPSPNELTVWTTTAAWLLEEDPAGGEAGLRLAAYTVIAAFNDRLREEGLTEHLIGTDRTRPFYNALRDTIPGVCVESTNRTYISCVKWTAEALEWRNLPPFKAPYG